MDGLDLILLVFVVVYALSGFRQGFLVGSASTAGLLLGGLLGVNVVPLALDHLTPGLSVSLAALLLVLVAAFVGQGLGALLGHRLRDRVTWRPARVLDALSGALLSVVAMLLIAWALGVAASGAQLNILNRQVRNSVVLSTVDGALPGGSDRVLSAFNAVVGSSRFPRYLEPFATEHIKEVPSPTSAIASRHAVSRAQSSVVKIVGDAHACYRTLEGSGFVYARHRVMTNAHVVAGVSHPVVSVGDSSYHSRVVYYDPDTDVAVLSVPRLSTRVLRFGGPAASGSMAAVLGYPENGPYDVEPARIRDAQTLRSPNIYSDGTVYRDTYSIYSRVRQGNSGGPLVNPAGQVIGVVFAASLTDARTGYALTSSQVHGAARQGRLGRASVTTGSCAG